MKDLLARTLLAEVTGLRVDQLEVVTNKLQALASLKYDDYEGYSPAVKFFESLATWLSGLAPADRKVALDFILDRLTYVSSTELDHLVSTVYPDILRPMFLEATASELGLPRWAVAHLASSQAFRSVQRKTLILGMSDGARLDKLRRFSPLSTEQFHLVSQLDPGKVKSMLSSLREALPGDPNADTAQFERVIVVDDFSASGSSMLREEDGVLTGKLEKIRVHVEKLKGDLIAQNATVTVLIYLMTSKAHTQLSAELAESGFLEMGFSLSYAHKFGESLPLSPSADGPFWDLCMKYFQPGWANKHTEKGGRFEHGYAQCALPLVMHHNTPNNAPPMLWKDDAGSPFSVEAPAAKPWYGVFPRHERHHPDRP
ncbi:MAG: hypothetical protein JWO68_4278 [Actinomycetia bacterium]|nr:hypothetical protein [Actinomycetes bacterium]